MKPTRTLLTDLLLAPLRALHAAVLVASACANNTVGDNEGWGLFVDGATRGTIVPSNIIEDTGCGRQKTATGIRIGKQAGDVQLEGNNTKAEAQVRDDRERGLGENPRARKP